MPVRATVLLGGTGGFSVECGQLRFFKQTLLTSQPFFSLVFQNESWFKSYEDITYYIMLNIFPPPEVL